MHFHFAAVAGAKGGYEIPEQFRLDRHLATLNDYSYILTALKGLVSAVDDEKAKSKEGVKYDT